MQKVILITGSTDGIGLVTAEMLLSQGHKVLLHGRNRAKLQKVEETLSKLGSVESYVADLSDLADVRALANAVAEKHQTLDVLINNAGVFNVPDTITADGYDVRFMVNTFAPYLLTKKLLPLLGENSRVVNLSSAAQATVDINAMLGKGKLSDNAAYAQSKLAITMWTREMAKAMGSDGPIVVAVNPASFLGSKMVKDAYGVAGNDLSIGADILCRAALSEEFADASGKYYDNDARQFASPHPDALEQNKCEAVVRAIESLL